MDVAQDLEPLLRPIDSLQGDPANARLHSRRNLDAIKDSLSMFGQRTPIVAQRVDGQLVIRKGNGTRAAALELGWEQIAVVVIEEDDARAIAYAIADNRSGELAEWDWEVLDDLLGVVDSVPGIDEAFLSQVSHELGNIEFEPIEKVPGEQKGLEQVTITVVLRNWLAQDEATDAIRTLCEHNPEWEAELHQ